MPPDPILNDNPSKHIALAEAIIENERLRSSGRVHLTNAKLAEVHGTTVGYVYQVRRDLQLAGRLPRISQRSRTEYLKPKKETPGYTPKGPSVIDPEDPQSLLRLVENEPILDQLGRARILSRLIRLGAPATKLSAIKLLEDISRQAEGRVGPPPPQTEDDQVAHLVRLMLVLPFTVCQRAYDTITATASSEEGSDAALQPDPRTVPLEAAEPAVPLRDLPETSPQAQPGTRRRS